MPPIRHQMTNFWWLSKSSIHFHSRKCVWNPYLQMAAGSGIKESEVARRPSLPRYFAFKSCIYIYTYIYIYIIIYVLGMGSHLGWSVNSLRLGDIYASVNWVTIDSGNGMAPLGTMPLTEPLMTYYCMGTTSSEIGINILQFSVKKMYLKMLSAKRQPFCSSLNM